MSANSTHSPGRRQALRLLAAAGLASAAGALPGLALGAASASRAARRMEWLAPTGPLKITATEAQGLWPVRPNAWTLTYKTETADGLTLYDPVLRLRRGQSCKVEFVNDLAEPSVIHWHGLDVDWRQSGMPNHAVPTGGRIGYDLPIVNRAATLWYHPHPANLTAPQTFNGLASILVVEDEDSDRLNQALELTPGETDLPLMIQDKRFNPPSPDGETLAYATSASELFSGMLGDQILVNGQADPVQPVATRPYRLRLVNGSTSRVYCPALLLDGRILPWSLIATDAGFLESPLSIGRFFLAPGERAELVADFSALPMGSTVELVSLEFEAMHGSPMGMGGMGMGGMRGSRAPLVRPGPGERFRLARFRVDRTERTSARLPERLAQPASLPQPETIRRIGLTGMHGWRIMGQSYDMDEIAFTVDRRRPEIWEFVNRNHMMGAMPHPMHLHGYPFRVLSREGSPALVDALALDRSGRTATDFGPKDVVMVWPGEVVRVVIDFREPDYAPDQLFMLHCHNLEHEDRGMMLNFLVS